MGLSTVQKVSRSGNAFIVNIPKKIVDILEIKMGDYINIDWGEVMRIDKKKSKRRKKEEDVFDDILPEFLE